MHSIRVTLLGLVALLPLVSAAPAQELAERGIDCGWPIKGPTGPTPTLPQTDGTTQLPNTTLSLVAIAIGRGTQNYTCSAAGATPASNGAKATLFDATSLAYTSTALLHAIPPLAVYAPEPSGDFYLAAGVLPILGHHYFDAALTPTFELTALNKVLHAAKVAQVNAPAAANKGPSGTGAVPWLDLNAKPAPYVSTGLQQVYRVVTAGGVAPACTAAGDVEVQYAAEYWFYD